MKTFSKNIKLFFTSLFTLLLIAFSSCISLAKDNLVNPTDVFYVNDYANILDDNVKQYIVDVNEEFENFSQKPQVVVTTVTSLNDMSIEEYSYKLLEKFKIGNKKYDNGVLILIAPTERDIRIEVGYGLEGAIPDSKAGSILDSALSYLSNNDFSTGVEKIFTKVCNEIATEYKYDISDLGIDKSLKMFEEDDKAAKHKKFLTYIYTFTLFCITVAIIAADAIFNEFRLTSLLLDILQVLACFRGSSGGSSRNSGGGGRSGGGGASRGF